ncbi:MAG: hypothetical protein H0X38_01945 [Planctomycetes bacterium]|nr:hypothetical protein [Planctomycetota bacterium]
MGLARMRWCLMVATAMLVGWRPAAAGEAAPAQVPREAPPLAVRCIPDPIVLGVTALTTWSIIARPSYDGSPGDVILSRDHVDRMVFGMMTEVTLAGESDGFSRTRERRVLPVAEDQILTMPVEVIMPGWRMFASGARKPFAGMLECWWDIGELATTAKTPLALVAPPPPASLPGAADPPPRVRQAFQGLDGGLVSTPALTTADDLIFHLTRVPDEYAQPEAWASGAIEWTRLPTRAGGATVVFSPFRAGLRQLAGPGGVAAALPALPCDLHFPVAQALQDPRTGLVPPGIYSVRLAMVRRTVPVGGDTSGPLILVLAHTPHRFVQILARDEQPVPLCPACGVRLPSDPAAGHVHP